MEKMLLEAQAGMLSSRRYEHTKQVAKLAMLLAEFYKVDADDVYTAAMLHDITKEYDLMQQLQILNKSDIITDIASENLLHAATASLIARDNFGIKNTDILNAIRYHTTGRANMSILEKIVYIADVCSYDRVYKEAEYLRGLAFEDIDKAILFSLEYTIIKLMKKHEKIDMCSVECYNYLLGES